MPAIARPPCNSVCQLEKILALLQYLLWKRYLLFYSLISFLERISHIIEPCYSTYVQCIKIQTESRVGIAENLD